MSIKFLGVKGQNRLRLKPKSVDAELINADTGIITNPNAIPQKIFDDSYAICLKPAQISCDGAWSAWGMMYGLDYTVGWTLFINDIEYGRFTQSDPLDYYGSSRFDGLIQFGWVGEGIFYIQAMADKDVRIRLKPDSIPQSKDLWRFYDIEPNDETMRDSLNVIVDDDATIQVCLHNTQLIVNGPS